MKAKLLAAAAALVSPVQLTIAELQDKYDESNVTAFQLDLVIGAWGQWFVLLIILLVGSKALADMKDAKEELQSMREEKP